MRAYILSLTADPNVAFTLIVTGLFAIYWELCAPGAVLPGTAGMVCVLVGIYSLTRYPMRPLAVAVLALGVPLALYLTARRPAIWSIAGASLLMHGATVALLAPPRRINGLLAAVLCLLLTITTVLLLHTALRAHANKAL